MNFKHKLIKPSFAIAALSMILLFTTSCKPSIPEGATAVKNFDYQKYLGKWYEIARIDFKYEKDLNQTTANYSLIDNGNIKVINRGYNYVTNEWQESVGEAKFVGPKTEAMLKVTFFKPFWSGYNVIDLSNDYKYALVAGRNLDYLWILSREKNIPNDIKSRFLEKAKLVAYDTSRLIWIEQK